MNLQPPLAKPAVKQPMSFHACSIAQAGRGTRVYSLHVMVRSEMLRRSHSFVCGLESEPDPRPARRGAFLKPSTPRSRGAEHLRPFRG